MLFFVRLQNAHMLPWHPLATIVLDCNFIVANHTADYISLVVIDNHTTIAIIIVVAVNMLLAQYCVRSDLLGIRI